MGTMSWIDAVTLGGEESDDGRRTCDDSPMLFLFLHSLVWRPFAVVLDVAPLGMQTDPPP